MIKELYYRTGHDYTDIIIFTKEPVRVVKNYNYTHNLSITCGTKVKAWNRKLKCHCYKITYRVHNAIYLPNINYLNTIDFISKRDDMTREELLKEYILIKIDIESSVKEIMTIIKIFLEYD